MMFGYFPNSLMPFSKYTNKTCDIYKFVTIYRIYAWITVKAHSNFFRNSPTIECCCTINSKKNLACNVSH